MKIVSQSIIFICISAATALIHMVLVGFFSFFFLVCFTIASFLFQA